MKWFDYTAPATLSEAVGLLAAHPGAKALAGGTDLLVQMRAGRIQPGLVVDIKHIPEMNEIDSDTARGLTLGAAVPCYRIYGHAAVRQHYPALAEVAALIGGVQVQGRASIGGNLCNAAPSADSVPLLIALGARCRVAGPAGEREVAVEEFCTAPGRNCLAPGEVLVSLLFPAPAAGQGACYLRFIPRNEMDIAVAGAGVSVVVEDGVVRQARVALSSVAPTPLFVPEAGSALVGQPAAAEAIGGAIAAARQAARPISDMRGTAEFRRHLCGVLTARALTSAIERAGGNGHHA